MEDMNLKVFNMIKAINESKTLAKYISCECRCEFDGRKCKWHKNGTRIRISVSVKNQQYIVDVKKIVPGS